MEDIADSKPDFMADADAYFGTAADYRLSACRPESVRICTAGMAGIVFLLCYGHSSGSLD
jgi:hypothetical protein